MLIYTRKREEMVYLERYYDRIKFLETILDNMPEPIYVLDKRGNFIYVNRAMIDLSGASKKTLLGYDMYQLAREGFIERAVSESVLAEKRQLSFFQDVVSHRGKRYRQLNTVTPVFDSNGNIEYMVAVLLPMDDLNQRLHTADGTGVYGSMMIPAELRVNDRDIIAESPAMKRVLELAKALSDVDISVLITGETGCGKDVVAHLIHNLGRRKEGSFVTINCASLPENLLEAELFGYVKGAFTGASSTGKRGLIEEADGGTLFLDEINSMPLTLQGKLLQALESKSFTKVGSTKSTSVNFRVLAASNQDLQLCVQNGTFRQDLYYRLNVMPIEIPPLREREEDIEPLVNYFLRHYGEKYDRPRCLSQKAMLQLKVYDWPGNVRELKNLVERLVVISSGDVIEINELPPSTAFHGTSREDRRWAFESPTIPPLPLIDEQSDGFSLDNYMEQCERILIKQALDRFGSTYKAAEFLKSSQSTIARRKVKYGL